MNANAPLAPSSAPAESPVDPTWQLIRILLRCVAIGLFVIIAGAQQYRQQHQMSTLELEPALWLVCGLLGIFALSFLDPCWFRSRSFWTGAGCVAAVVLVTGLAWWLSHVGVLGPRGQAMVGIVCFIGLAAGFSANLSQVPWRTVAFGLALQIALAVLILEFEITWNGETVRPVYQMLDAIGRVVTKFLAFSDRGAEFVFGPLADRGGTLGKSFGPANAFVFAFRALPVVIFLSAFFTVLYYIGLLPFIVKWMARGMMGLMRTSGAESLSAAANVFVGQTEAPLIVKPFVPRMTQSELLTVMAGGMATIAGSVMAVYIGMGADAVAILATSVMAAPCSLYLSKIVLPETEVPETLGKAQPRAESPHRNVIDAFSSGASDGVHLAINIGAMLIAFIALIALIDSVLGLVHDGLSLGMIFARLFSPAAFLMGIEPADTNKVGALLGTKLAANEFVAYAEMTRDYAIRTETGVVVHGISARSYQLATFALTGFANFASIGIQIGGIGAMAPERRRDLARLGGRALFVGFIATMLNAAIAGVLVGFP